MFSSRRPRRYAVFAPAPRRSVRADDAVGWTLRLTSSMRARWPERSTIQWKVRRKAMATTATPGTPGTQNRPRRRSQQPRVSVRALEASDGGAHEHEYDLLTAALLGITI